MGAKVVGHGPSSQACVTPLQRDDSSTLALLQGITSLRNGPGPEGPVPGLQWHMGLLLHADSPT